jgi:hypothetical protein
VLTDEPGGPGVVVVPPPNTAVPPPGQQTSTPGQNAPNKVASHPVQPRAVRPGVPLRTSAHAQPHPVQPGPAKAAHHSGLIGRIERSVGAASHRVVKSVEAEVKHNEAAASAAKDELAAAKDHVAGRSAKDLVAIGSGVMVIDVGIANSGLLLTIGGSTVVASGAAAEEGAGPEPILGIGEGFRIIGAGIGLGSAALVAGGGLIAKGLEPHPEHKPKSARKASANCPVRRRDL